MAAFENIDSREPGKPYAVRNVEGGEVAAPGPALRSMHEDIELIATLLGGTRAIRQAKRTYLPQHAYEPNENYNKRLAMSYLDNYTLRTLNTLVGKAFKEPPQPGEGMPTPLEPFMSDVDDMGTGLVPFGRQWFRKGVEQAVAHVLVDMQAAEPRPDGAARTKADDIRDGLRPHWRLITADDMLDLQEAKINGKVVTTLARYRDDELQQKGEFGTELVERVKVLRRDAISTTWEAWELQKGPRGGKPKWVKTMGPLPYGLKHIPVVSFYTNKTGVGEGRSELTDLAHMNVRHWQSTSDQINILTVCRFPMLAASGVRDSEGEGSDGQLVVGPNKFLSTPDPQSKIYFVEHTGAAVDSGKGELERLEQAMASYGAEFLKKGTTGPETASGRILDAGEAISPLQAWGLDFKDCLELCGWYTAQWLGLGKEVETPFDFEIETDDGLLDGADMATLDSARGRKDISRLAWVNEAKRRGILCDEYDPEEDAQEILDEPPPPGGGLDGMFTDKKQKPKPKSEPEV